MSEFEYEDAAMNYYPDDEVPTGALSAIEGAKQAHERELMSIDGVEGVGVGSGAILVYVRDAAAESRVPSVIGGQPVKTIITGRIDAIPL